MGINFNITKKEEEEEIKDEEEMEEEEEKSHTTSLPRKNMIKFMLFIGIGLLLLLLILYIISTLSSRTYTYEEIENIMKKAAQSYFTDHPESLPTTEGNIVEIDSSNLVVSEKMKDLSEYTDGEICTGKVQVQKLASDYLYVPYLNCGENYTTIEFYSKVLADNPTVSSGYGLYATSNAYIYRGEEVNNYVKLDKGLWRIVKITSNNNVVLVHDEGLPYTQPWDNRYNEENLYDAGINQYSASRVKESLERVLLNPSEKNGEVILSDADKAKTVPFTICTGKRNSTSEVKNNSEECKETLPNQRIGLLTLSDYLYASVDPNCKSAETKSCKNYNYLALNDSWWLVTANKEDTSTVFAVSRRGNVATELAANYALVRPVIYLNSRVLYKSGNGSLTEPYEVR